MSSILVTVATYIDPPIAYLAKSRLDYEGIPCWIADDYHINLKWTISSALGGVKLRVQESDIEDAIKVLTTDCSGDLEGIEAIFPEPDNDEYCNKCGSLDLYLLNWSRKAAALSLLIGFPILFFRKRLKCRNCGNIMKMNGA